MCCRADQPTAALINDLKARGLLDDTLVIWGGEFGRTPMTEGNNGRDHNPYGFTMLLAGGGVKGGHVHGTTDEFGLYGVEGRVHVHDFHATILHLLGLRPREADLPAQRPRRAADRRLRQRGQGRPPMTPFDPDAYPAPIAELWSTDRLPELGPGTPNAAVRDALQSLSVDRLVPGNAGTARRRSAASAGCGSTRFPRRVARDQPGPRRLDRLVLARDHAPPRAGRRERQVLVPAGAANPVFEALADVRG